MFLLLDDTVFIWKNNCSNISVIDNGNTLWKYRITFNELSNSKFKCGRQVLFIPKKRCETTSHINNVLFGLEKWKKNILNIMLMQIVNVGSHIRMIYQESLCHFKIIARGLTDFNSGNNRSTAIWLHLSNLYCGGDNISMCRLPLQDLICLWDKIERICFF